MSRPRRQVTYAASPSGHSDDDHEILRRRQLADNTQSPIRKINRVRKPRHSGASSIADDDEPASPGSPYSPQSDAGRRKNGKIPAPAAKFTLQKQAMHNRRSVSGNQIHIQAHTPRQVSLRDDSIPSNLQVVGTALTPASKRPMPILSNFEDWLKLATDNKINANNSWNFALIDYFHEMSLLKDENGKGINFQKASCTLDGCVKIYSSRVESVGVEAGRLLSGLATSGTEEGKKKRREGEEESDEDGEDSGGEGGKKEKKKRKPRSHEATLAPSFASLQLKKLELEFAVDPLFKKASADFDEGGAKGLLLNHLSINEDGRIVFDSSDDAADGGKIEKNVNEEDEEHSQAFDESDAKAEQPERAEEPEIDTEIEIDLGQLASKFFPNLSILDQCDICPSMKDFKIGDLSAAMSIPLLRGDNNDWKKESVQNKPPQIDGDLALADQSGLFLDGSNGVDFDDDDGLGGFDLNEEGVGFGEGGEAWAREAAVEPMLRPVNVEEDENAEEVDGYALSMQHRYREDAEQETMLAFFGKAFNSRAKVGTKAFQTLTNWRIAKIQQAAETVSVQRQRKEKEPFKVDFHGERSENLRKLLNEKAVPNDKISLPKTQLKTKGRNLLDKDDEVIDAKSMMRLWTKPKCRVGRRKGEMAVIDEGFGSKGREQQLDSQSDEDEPVQGDYDANFFADDEPLGLPFDGLLPIDDDDDENDQPGFVDAREMLSPPPGEQPQIDDVFQSQEPATQEMLPGSFGSQLVTQQGRRLRPEYVNYARTAKKVDVRALKENMWKGMSSRLNVFSDDRLPTPALTDDDGDIEMDAELPRKEDEVLKFTDILGSLKHVYPDQQMKDISTSYGFICLLHLANEKGLVLEGGREDGMMEEILVRKDENVDAGYVGE